ncbi:hypothetical protein HPP92_025725 [Vanilla planifolia]|uniref:Beta-glucuronosyltransferase GlcAT14A n=1 Tax=Vanilla planifolia TaxID=51239 RepID=A0A835UCL8_VANPL|nr:hypothetical protein HPP92_025725 [Vanilla planifolia]
MLSSISALSSSTAPIYLSKDSRQLYCVLITASACLLLLLSFSALRSSSNNATSYTSSADTDALRSSPLPAPPSFAYLLCGSSGDGDRLFRILLSVYHPKNLYLVHLDLAAPQDQRERLARELHTFPIFRSARNVHILGRAGFSNPQGSSALAATLHGAAVLLRLSRGWDWFINLSAKDYPLITQDDLLHVFSFLPRSLNFVQHSSYIGWRESRRLKQIIVDPSLYLSSKADVFYATQQRDLPNAFRIFTGSYSVILSRKFVEYINFGTNNLPRALLMYYANTPSAHMNYLHTVLCNSPEFNRTIVNNHLHYVRDENPNRHLLGLKDFNNMTLSGAAFGSGFPKDDPVLDKIDQQVLNRGPRGVVPGGWCLGGIGSDDPCGIRGNPDALMPGPGTTRLAKNIVQLLTTKELQSHQCIWVRSL